MAQAPLTAVCWQIHLVGAWAWAAAPQAWAVHLLALLMSLVLQDWAVHLLALLMSLVLQGWDWGDPWTHWQACAWVLPPLLRRLAAPCRGPLQAAPAAAAWHSSQQLVLLWPPPLVVAVEVASHLSAGVWRCLATQGYLLVPQVEAVAVVAAPPLAARASWECEGQAQAARLLLPEQQPLPLRCVPRRKQGHCSVSSKQGLSYLCAFVCLSACEQGASPSGCCSTWLC